MQLRSQTKRVKFSETNTKHIYILNKFHNYVKNRPRLKQINRCLRAMERKLKSSHILLENEYFDYKIIKTD